METGLGKIEELSKKKEDENCISYPHLHKKDFTSRLIGVIENCSVCPIVFNVYERLKERI